MNPITLEELQETWPKDDSGRAAAALLQRYAFTLLVETAVGADCNPVSAQAEAASNKALAKMVKDFGTLTVPKPEAAPKRPMQQLHRFRSEQPEPEKTES